jgi:ATP-dependent Clp protease adaptor protein ClpS
MNKQIDTELEDSTELFVIEPKKYSVFLLNDDYTSMEFVIKVLIEIFHHNEADAMNIMMSVHNNGKGLCGAYPLDIAQTKVSQVQKGAKSAGFPLKAAIEEEL